MMYPGDFAKAPTLDDSELLQTTPSKPQNTHWLRWAGRLLLMLTCVATMAIQYIRGSSRDVLLGADYTASQKRLPLGAISHQLFDELVSQHVDEDGMVDYAAMLVPTESAKLDRYLEHLSTGDPGQSATDNAQMAFWINAYNAVTIRGILREYPTSSIRNHTSLVGYHIWKNLKLRVGGDAYSLEQIEHDILRKMGDPRIHFAIVCASKGCPRLLNEAYVARQVNSQLEANAVDFFNRLQNFQWDASEGEFHLSAILKWFAGDFGEDQTQRLQTIKPWLPREAAALLDRSSVSVSYLPYNWDLNSQGKIP